MKPIYISILIVVLLYTSYCQNLSWFQSAELRPKGTAEVIPSAAFTMDRGAFRPSRGPAYGVQLSYGVSDRVNLILRNASSFQVIIGDRLNFSYLGLATKIRIISDRLALSIPVGFNFSEYFNVQTDVKLICTKRSSKGLLFSVAPSLDLLTGIYTTFGFGTDLNIGIPIRKNSTRLFTEAGLYIWPGSEWYTSASLGIGFAFGVWEESPSER